MRDIKDQNSNVVNSPLLQNFIQKGEKSQQVLPLYTHRSVSNIQANYSNNAHMFLINNRQAFCQTSRKKIKPNQAQFQQRYQQIQKILTSQNQNLKKQNEYLAYEIRQVAKKEKKLRKQVQQITYRSNKKQDQILKLEQILSQLSIFIQQNIQNLVLLLQVNTLDQIKNSLTSFLQGLSIILCLDGTEKLHLQKIRQHNNMDHPNFSAIDREIEELGVRLEQMLKQNNNSCRNPSVRRQFIQIAKNIKQLQKAKKETHFLRQPIEASFFDRGDIFGTKHTRVYSNNHQKTTRFSYKQYCITKNEQFDDKFKYPKQIYCKVTRRRSGSRDNKLLHMNSVCSVFNKRDKH